MHLMGTSALVVGVGYVGFPPPPTQKKPTNIKFTSLVHVLELADVFLEFVQNNRDPEFNWLWARFFLLLNFVRLKIW
jgi:hypothetical protein